jgi:hypothetical protein
LVSVQGLALGNPEINVIKRKDNRCTTPCPVDISFYQNKLFFSAI